MNTLVWSATPTPLTQDLQLDLPSVARMVDYHLRLGVDGIMILGTCGEGPWLPDTQRQALLKETLQAAQGRLGLTIQTTESSAARTLEQIEIAAALGAERATVAQPWFLLNATPANIEAYYLEIFERSPLPIAFYDRGKHATVSVPDDLLATLYSHPAVTMVKDSSASPERRDIALLARQNRPELILLNGDEFSCTRYLQAGYDGVMLGGGIVNARYVRAIAAALQKGDVAEAQQIDTAMQTFLFGIYGGPKIVCWLTGLKETLVRLGVFSTHANHLRYPLTPECSAEIDALLCSEAAWLN